MFGIYDECMLTQVTDNPTARDFVVVFHENDE